MSRRDDLIIRGSTGKPIDGLCHVGRGVLYDADRDGERRDISVSFLDGMGQFSPLVLIGPTQATWQKKDGAHPVFTPAQARRVARALLEAADWADGGDGVDDEEGAA